jgi:heterotetrameric sarcosine oxidase gamma subunit
VTDRIEPRSPFHRAKPSAPALAAPTSSTIRLTEAQVGAILHVRVPARTTALGDVPAPGRSGRDRLGSLVTSVAPGDHLVFVAGELADAAVLEWSAKASAADGTAVDITHGRAVLRLAGPAAVDVLARVCSIDLERTPPGHALTTSLAGVVTGIVREPDEESSYLLDVDRSYGRYLLGVLLDAGQEVGIELDE